MHKTPKGFRFITAGKDTILSDLSTQVGKCLSRLQKTTQNSKYHVDGIRNCNFIIDNRTKVINFLNESNNGKNNKKKISSWDFSNLYTNIPHNKLMENIRFFVLKVFSIIDKEYICSSPKSKSAYFSKSKSKHNASFDKHSLLLAISYIIDNSYIAYHGKIYRQILGIPMGTNCAPFLANLFLHVYEYKYLLSLVDDNKKDIALKLSNVFRYQDDCLVFNDDGLFSKHYKKIYPSELTLNNTNISRDKSTFLDIQISIHHGKFLYKSYDKRNDFDFRICNFPHITGNIPTIPSYGVYMSQLVRLVDINKSFGHFKTNLRTMTFKFTTQGFKLSKLRSKFMEFCTRFIHKWSKFNTDLSEASNVNDIFF